MVMLVLVLVPVEVLAVMNWLVAAERGRADAVPADGRLARSRRR